jgi:FtsZ-interacting cell division protein YlmF
LEKAEKLESYPLYGTMKKISAAIFEWEPSDIEVLRKAKLNKNGNKESPENVKKE